jgi:integron integrase
MEKKKWPALALRVFAKCAAMGRAPSTGLAYWNWFEKFLRFQRQPPKWEWVKPESLGREEIEKFLTHLAAKERVSPSTQNQAFSGILFVYKHVLGIKIEAVNALRAYQPKYIPEVLSAKELTDVLGKLNGRNLLIAYLCAGAGLRIGEVFALRIKDIRFDLGRIHIRQAKGHKDRIVQLPEAAVPLLRQQIEHVQRLHALDEREGKARVPLPYGLERKYPGEASKLYWYWLFCSDQRSEDPETGREGRWHRDPTTFTRPLADAARDAGIPVHLKSHTLRHTFATLMMNNRVPLKSLSDLLGHKDLNTTAIYLHVEQAAPAGLPSPVDLLALRIAKTG